MADSKCAFRFNYQHPRRNFDSGCQFDADEPLFHCGGKRYCRFHLPFTDEELQPTVKTGKSGFDHHRFNQAIYKLIGRAREKGSSVDLTGVVFPGDFPCENQRLPEVLWYGALFSGHTNFKDSQFTGDAGFKSTRFTDSASFEGTQFTGNASFEGAQFTGDAVFRGVRFERDALFRGARFERDALFDRAQFTTIALFDSAQFTLGARFQGALFKGHAIFKRVQFTDYAWFKSACVEGDGRFCSAQFTGDALFQNTQFTSKARFEGVRFECDAWFEDTQFTGTASFDRAQFTDDASFERAQFTGSARFKGAQFMVAASFKDAQFTGDTSFKNAQFKHDADFSTSNPSSISHGTARRGKRQEERTVPRASFRYLDFSGGNVNGVAYFSDRIFTRAADFSGRTFGKAPLFHGCNIHQGTNWHDAKFRSYDGHDAEMSYRTLRLAMEEIRDRSQEAIFFSHEQKTRRGNLKWWKPERWISWIYQLTSGYGRSIVRPVFGWLLISSVFLLIYWWWTGQPMNASVFGALVKFTLLQTVKPFSVWGEIHVDFTVLFQGGIPIGPQLLATLHSILSLTFIALLILALRWLFKRG